MCFGQIRQFEMHIFKLDLSRNTQFPRVFRRHGGFHLAFGLHDIWGLKQVCHAFVTVDQAALGFLRIMTTSVLYLYKKTPFCGGSAYVTKICGRVGIASSINGEGSLPCEREGGS
jgi:hypothetical protein